MLCGSEYYHRVSVAVPIRTDKSKRNQYAEQCKLCNLKRFNFIFSIFAHGYKKHQTYRFKISAHILQRHRASVRKQRHNNRYQIRKRQQMNDVQLKFFTILNLQYKCNK